MFFYWFIIYLFILFFIHLLNIIKAPSLPFKIMYLFRNHVLNVLSGDVPEHVSDLTTILLYVVANRNLTS